MSLIRGLFWLVYLFFLPSHSSCFLSTAPMISLTVSNKEAERVKNFVVEAVSKPKASPSPGAKKK